MALSVKLEIPNVNGTFNRIFDKGTKTYANTRVHFYCSPYVPMDTGNLDQDVDITDQFVHYKVPYAKVNYEGTNRNFSKEKHPLATAYWDKAMLAAKGGQLANDITNYIKSK